MFKGSTNCLFKDHRQNVLFYQYGGEFARTLFIYYFYDENAQINR